MIISNITSYFIPATIWFAFNLCFTNVRYANHAQKFEYLDTISPPANIEWKNVDRLTATGNALDANMNNGQKINFSRKDFEIFAREKGWVDSVRIIPNAEIIPAFPGGMKDWIKFLQEHVQYPPEAMDSIIQGNVTVQFLVDKDGQVDQIQVISGPEKGGIREESIRVLKASGRWHPGIHQLNLVSSYNRITLSFTLEHTESEFPGGLSAWMNYLNKTFRYPAAAVRDSIEGTVIAQFVIEKDGSVTEVVTIAGPLSGGLRDEVVRIIKNSGKWVPATVNGIPVRTYKKQPVSFSLRRF